MPSQSTVSVGMGPWLPACLGLCACLVSAVWSVVRGENSSSLEPLRLLFIWLGLLLTGSAVAVGFRAPCVGPVARSARLALPFLALIFASLAAGVTVVLVASWLGQYLMGLRPGLALVLWLFVSPMSALAGWQCLQRASASAPMETRHQAALVLLLAGGVALLARFALSSPSLEFSQNWFTIQRFLLVLALAALAAAPLTVVDGVTRRFVVSGLVTFHLLGIVTAALSHPPTPWIMSQIRTRIYQPYLEFLYLSNAYHFYSPEPGPASYVWFRLYYTDEHGQKLGHWYKIPRLSDSGHHGHTTSLEYQRHLSIAEYTIQGEPVRPESVLFEKLIARRLAMTPEGAKQEPIVGVNPIKLEVLVPLNPMVPKSQQHRMPRRDVKQRMETYARHVLHKFQKEYPERDYQSVRIYRVVHDILSIQSYNAGLPPTDPVLYTPIYMGEFDADGKLLDPDDGLLYWQLPILRDRPGLGHSEIKDWARRHAGDPYWRRVIQHDERAEWVDDNGKLPPPEKN